MCGSGTTCVQTKLNNRQFIGIEISEEYCDIARKRLQVEAQANQVSMF
jgi:site-specific DNA-methyltransferase (adenine-specific)